MSYLVTLALIWAVPLTSFAMYWLGVNAELYALLTWGYMGVVLGIPAALIMTAVALPTLALAQLSDAWRRRR